MSLPSTTAWSSRERIPFENNYHTPILTNVSASPWFKPLLADRIILPVVVAVSQGGFCIFFSAYTEVGGDEDLPLGEEFQELVGWFNVTDGDKHQYVSKLVQQLE